jgi:hypothetical protein
MYPTSPELIEWLNQTLLPIEASVFHYFRGIVHLVRIVDDVEAGLTLKYNAFAAIRDWNEKEGTSLSYEEIRDRSSTYIFSDIGEWVVYTDTPDAILSGQWDDPSEALQNADPGVTWICLWETQKNRILVVRSPHVEGREWDDDIGHCRGISCGNDAAYVFPPSIQAAIGTCDPREILQTQSTEEHPWC